jgi:hypothetical protein
MKSHSSAKIFLSMLLSSLCIYRQGNLKGIVKDSLTVDKLNGVEIILTGTNFSSVSNTDGEFKITFYFTDMYNYYKMSKNFNK